MNREQRRRQERKSKGHSAGDAARADVRSDNLQSEASGQEAVRALLSRASAAAEAGDIPEARTLQERAVETSATSLGHEHPQTMVALQNLAQTMSRQGDLAGARAVLERVLEVRTRRFGAENADTLKTLTLLCATVASQGDLASARGLQQRALDGCVRVHGPDHAETTTARFNLAKTLVRLDRPAAAPHIAALNRLRLKDRTTLTPAERKALDGLADLEMTETPVVREVEPPPPTVEGPIRFGWIWKWAPGVALLAAVILFAWLYVRSKS